MAGLWCPSFVEGAEQDARVLARDAAIMLAREGQLPQARRELEALIASDPTSPPGMAFDLAVILAWQGRDQEAVEQFARTPVAELPTYVLQTYAKSLRNLKRWNQALEVYQHMQTLDVNPREARYGRILTLADANRPAQARSELGQIEQAELADAEWVQYAFSCGYVEERERNFVGALDCYNQGLRLQPDHIELRRRRVVVASALGATQFALGEVESNPDLVRQSERAQIELDADALRIRWSNLAKGPERTQAVEAWLQGRSRLIAATEAQQRVLTYDEIVALVAIYRMDEALLRVQSLYGQGLTVGDLPAYVLEALGFAHLYLEAPETAIDRFQLALSKLPQTAKQPRHRITVGLFYALSDAERLPRGHASCAIVASARITVGASNRTHLVGKPSLHG